MTMASSHLEAVNKSGYPLQVAIAHTVTSGRSKHGWRVLYEEHSWKHGNQDGFIDIALEHENLQVVLVIECKRPQGQEWIFLPPKGSPEPRRHARASKTLIRGGALVHGFPTWSDESVDPPTPLSVFCVAPKATGNLTVDRLGSELISATRALALEECQYLQLRGGDARRLYFAVIVTTAQLFVGEFDPGEISLADGTLSKTARFQNADAVRFSKQLSVEAAAVASYGDYGREAKALAQAKARTVFIINAEKLDAFLNHFDADDRDKYG